MGEGRTFCFFRWWRTTDKVVCIPFGTMHLDGRGRVLDHEDSAHREFVGRNLLKSLGPRAAAEQARKCYRAFLARGGDKLELDVVLAEAGEGERRVRFYFGRICGDLAIVRIRPH